MDRIKAPARERSFGLKFKLAAACTAFASFAAPAWGAEDIKVGTVMGFSGLFGLYSNIALDAFNMAIEEAGGQAAGRKIVVIKEDDKTDPKFAIQLARRFIRDDKVDFLLGPIATPVAAAVRDEVHRSKTFMIVPQATDDGITREFCSPYIVRTSFSSWQSNFPLGDYVAKNIGKRGALVAANFQSGHQQSGAFAEGFKKAGGAIVLQELPALGTADYASILTNIRARQDSLDVVYFLLIGPSVPAFVNQWAQSGMRDKIKILGNTAMADEMFFPALKDGALGQIGAGPYAAGALNTPRNNAFVALYQRKYNRVPILTEVAGYDAGKLLVSVVEQVKGNLKDKAAVRRAFSNAEIDSPRGYFKIDPKTGNVIQNIYITRVVKRPDGVYTHELLQTYDKVADPGTGCKMPAA